MLSMMKMQTIMISLHSGGRCKNEYRNNFPKTVSSIILPASWTMVEIRKKYN